MLQNLTKSEVNTGKDNGFGVVKQTNTWPSLDPDLCRHAALLDLNKLTIFHPSPWSEQ